MMKWRLAEPAHLIDISRLSVLDYIKDKWISMHQRNTEESALESKI